MGLVLKYARQTKAGTWHYRRRVPTKIRDFLKQGEFKRYLGSTEREALKNFPKVDAEFERLVAVAHRKASRLSDTSLSPLDVHREAERLARELAQGTVTIGGRTLPASDPDAADILRDSYFAQLPQDNETGEPVGEPDINGRAVNILANGGRLARPAPTLADAKRLYVRERITGDINETAKLNRIERVMEYLSHAIDATRPLSSLTREDARDVRDHMLRDLDMRPATVKRYMNDIRALVSFGITEYGLRDASNPFIRLPVKTEISVQEERSPIPEATLRAICSQLANHAGPTLLQIWRMLEGTGCRLGEALEAVVAAEGDTLFARYGRVCGADGASAAIMQHVRAITDDPKIVVHSLRHNMEDRLTRAGVSEFDRNLVLGHARGGMSERYGGPDARLEVAERALRAALADRAER